MFRSVYVTQGEKLTLKDNWLNIQVGDDIKSVPVEDLQIVVVDNPYALISTHALESLANNGTCLIVCGKNHMPCCNLLPLGKHYKPYGVLKKQIALTSDFKDLVWREIVKAKIINQATVLEIIGNKNDRMYSLAAEVLPGDTGNREGIAAKMFFKGMYGCNFLRFEDDIINKALNYGYAIIRSVVARSLCGYGYNCVLGIHHINEYNAFNLADDFMEPLRPFVDLWVYKHNEELITDLTKGNKMGLINITNHSVFIEGKEMRLYNAVEKYIASFTSSINSSQISKLVLPYVKNND